GTDRAGESLPLRHASGSRLHRGAMTVARWTAFGVAAALSASAAASDVAWYLTATNVTQWHQPYRSPSMLENSLDPHGRTEETSDLTLYAHQRGGTRSSNQLVLTIGRFSVADLFDANTYAHDPRADFLNYAVMDAGAFDYASDPWGFTNGIAAEWARGDWTLRGGAFQLPGIPNDRITARVDFGAYMLVAELERRYQIAQRPGKLKLLAFVNHARMANYRDALELARRTQTVPDVSLVRRDTSRAGLVLNLEQELSPALGVFARVS